MQDATSPATVLPIVAEAGEAIYEALRHGAGYADTLQPDLEGADPWFWSHSARFAARGHLSRHPGSSWSLVPRVPNSGIHLLVGDHRIRVVRSLARGIPHPGGNRARNSAWVGVPYQLQLGLTDGAGAQVSLSLIADWYLDAEREPLVHLSLPVGPWKYQENPRTHWRLILPAGGSVGIEQLPGFAGGDDGELIEEIPIDPSEWAAE